MGNPDSIKSRMKAFYEGLLDKDTIQAEVKTSTPLGARFFNVAIPATVFGLAAGLAPNVGATEVADSLPIIEASINGGPTKALPSLSRIAKNKAEADEKYKAMAFRGENDRLMACEVVLGDTFNEMAESRAKTMKWLLDYSTDKDNQTLDLLEKCLASGKQLPAANVDAAEQLAKESIEIGYQNYALEQSINAFNQAVIDDAGNIIQPGATTPAQAFSQHVRDRTSAGGWAAAAFSIAEGVARITGNNEIASHANKGARLSNSSDHYYNRGKREVHRDNPMKGAQGIGRILNDIGRDAERERKRQEGRNRY